MTSRDYCFWLQGFLEISKAGSSTKQALTGDQVEIIQKHLNLVFKHEIDPSFSDSEKLNELHHDGDPALVRC